MTCKGSCDECGNGASKKEKLPIGYESALAMAERHFKWLWYIVILLILFLVGTNAGWIWYESQFGRCLFRDNCRGI